MLDLVIGKNVRIALVYISACFGVSADNQVRVISSGNILTGVIEGINESSTLVRDDEMHATLWRLYEAVESGEVDMQAAGLGYIPRETVISLSIVISRFEKLRYFAYTISLDLKKVNIFDVTILDSSVVQIKKGSLPFNEIKDALFRFLWKYQAYDLIFNINKQATKYIYEDTSAYMKYFVREDSMKICRLKPGSVPTLDTKVISGISITEMSLEEIMTQTGFSESQKYDYKAIDSDFLDTKLFVDIERVNADVVFKYFQYAYSQGL